MPKIAQGRWNSASPMLGDSPRAPKGVDTLRLDSIDQHSLTSRLGDGTTIDSERTQRILEAEEAGIELPLSDLVTHETTSSVSTTGGAQTATHTIMDYMPDSIALSADKYGGEDIEIPVDGTNAILIARYSAPTGYTYTPPKTKTTTVVYNPIVRPPGSSGGPQEGW